MTIVRSMGGALTLLLVSGSTSHILLMVGSGEDDGRAERSGSGSGSGRVEAKDEVVYGRRLVIIGVVCAWTRLAS